MRKQFDTNNIIQARGHRHSGFTLLEGLIALSVISIIISYAFPNLDSFIKRQHGRVAQQTIMQAFKDARADAVNNGQAVVICGSTDGKHCDRGWNQSLIVFRDVNGNHLLDPIDQLIYKKQVTFKGAKLSTYRRYFRVRPMGNLASHPDSFRYCVESQDADQNWRAVVNRLGRVRIDKTERNGEPIRCI